jgi:hypothetical protein
MTRYDGAGFVGTNEKGVESVDREAFDRLSRLVAAAGSRRDTLRLLIGGAVAGTVAGVEGAAARKRRRSRAGNRGRVRSQQLEPLCPTTCNQNCSNKPIRGGVNLTKCNLSERDLDDVKLNGANLTKVCFEGSSLRNVNFRGAQLQGTCFCGADLRGADFRGTGVTQAQLDCAAILGCDTILPTGKRAVVCEADETCCDGFCVNLDDDPLNCGACGKRCQLNAECDEGQCACVVPACQDFDFGFTCCPPSDPVDSCACGLVNPGTVFTDPLTCDEIPAADCPEERRCVGPTCQACCPEGSDCDPSTGTCLQRPASP